MVLSSGPTYQASSVLFKAIEDEFGWSRALISGVASFGRFGGAMLGPVEGFLTDRFGSGKMVLVGFTMGGIGLIFFLLHPRCATVLLRVFPSFVGISASVGSCHRSRR